MKRPLLIPVIILLTLPLSAQKEGTIVMNDIVRQHARQEILDNPESEKTGRAGFVV
jgi:hypothetical protein